MGTGLFAALVVLVSCGQHEPAPISPDPASFPVARSSAPAPPLAPALTHPAEVARVDVAGDSPASFVRAADRAPPRILFLPGVCSNAYAYLLSFPEAARAHGGVVAIDGDRPCGAAGSGFRSFSWDPEGSPRFGAFSRGMTPSGESMIGSFVQRS